MIGIKENNNVIIHRQKIFLDNATTLIIDKSDFTFKKNWGLCFIPSAAQFHNYQPQKGSIILSLAILLTAEISTTIIMANNHYKNTLEPILRNQEGIYTQNDYFQAQNTYNTITLLTIGGIIALSCVYGYSWIDGFFTMNKIHNKLYK